MDRLPGDRVLRAAIQRRRDRDAAFALLDPCGVAWWHLPGLASGSEGLASGSTHAVPERSPSADPAELAASEVLGLLDERRSCCAAAHWHGSCEWPEP